MARLSKQERAAEMFWTPEEWRAAYERATRELELPPRGKRGSKANRIRRAMGGKIAALARRILWVQRARRVS